MSLILLSFFHEQGGPGAVVYAQLCQDPLDMLLNRAWTHAQGGPDLAVRGAPGQQGVNLAFTRGQQSKAVSLPA